MVDLLPVTGCHLEMCAMWLSLSLSLSWRMTPPAHWGFTGHAIPVSQLTRLTGDMTSETHRLHLQVGLSCVFCDSSGRERKCMSLILPVTIKELWHYALEICILKGIVCLSSQSEDWVRAQGWVFWLRWNVYLLRFGGYFLPIIHHRWHKCIFAIKCPCWWSN